MCVCVYVCVFCVGLLFCYVVICILSSFVINLLRKGELLVLL